MLIQGARTPQFNFYQPIQMGSLQQYLNGTQFKWASYNNIDPKGAGPFNLIFANQFKRATNNI